MKPSSLRLAALFTSLVFLAACGKKSEQAPESVPAEQQAPAEQPAPAPAAEQPAPAPAEPASCSQDCGNGETASISCGMGEKAVCDCNAEPKAKCEPADSGAGSSAAPAEPSSGGD